MNEILKKYREELHQIPETYYNEFKTKEYLKKELVSLGYSPVDILETGLYVYIDNNNPKTIAFRSDIDALKITEETGALYKSLHQGYMHACGHDGHMAMLLGLAYYLKDKIGRLKKNILLIFQPAEESVGGAKPICDTGILNKYNVESIFGVHLYPNLDEGIIGSRPNEFMARVNELDIIVHGKSSHGAMPELGIDANLILSKILIDFQTIQTRYISPLEYSILTFGKISGGTVRNIISDTATMEGTLRVFNNDVHKVMIKAINDICQGYEKMYNCNIEVNITDGYLPVVNDPTLYYKWKEALQEESLYEFPKPLMIAEDFSFYQQKVPGVFYYIGTRNNSLGYTNPLHNSRFNFTVHSLAIGLKSYITLLNKFNVL